ncbi:FitA-like ribbon-helix-helix domain-containing protein [Tepidimonas charontis]
MRAAQHGVSMEEEARRILRECLGPRIPTATFRAAAEAALCRGGRCGL